MIITTNMYFAAFILTEGLEVGGVEVVSDGKKGHTVRFSFKGRSEKEEQDLESAYETREAYTNIRRYLDSLTLIRDIIYSMVKRHKDKEKNTEGHTHAGTRRGKTPVGS